MGDGGHENFSDDLYELADVNLGILDMPEMVWAGRKEVLL